jgi:hypothetical protein
VVAVHRPLRAVVQRPSLPDLLPRNVAAVRAEDELGDPAAFSDDGKENRSSE